MSRLASFAVDRDGSDRLEQWLERLLVDFVGSSVRKVVENDDALRCLVVAQVLSGEAQDRSRFDCGARGEPHGGNGDLALAFVGESDDGGFDDGGVLFEHVFNLGGEHRVAAVLDDVLLAASELEESVPLCVARGHRCAANRRR